MKGCLTVIEAKLLQPVKKTVYSLLTYGANCSYLDLLTFGASATQCKPAKKGDPATVGRLPL